MKKIYITLFAFFLLNLSFIFNLSRAVYSESNMNQQFREYIPKGYIELGMTREEVRASWGEPKAIKHKKRNDYDEVWIYVPNWKFRNQLFFKNGILVKTDPDYLVVSRMEGHGVMP